MEHLITMNDLSREEIFDLINLTDELKADYQKGIFNQPLKNKTLGMIFEQRSTRTRVSFEVAMFQLGGQALYLNADDLHLGSGESLFDTVAVLSRYIDGIMIRTPNHNDVEKLSEVSSIPVINGQTNLHHPCQVLGDLYTIYEQKGGFKDLKLAYIGDGNNVANSLLLGCAKVGLDITVACPIGYECSEKVVNAAKLEAEKNMSQVNITNSPIDAARNADIIYSSAWFLNKTADRDEKHRALKDYQVNGYLFSVANEDCIFMHSLPAFRGIEVSPDIVDGSQSIVFTQAENRLHVQKAILQTIMK
jgi:ornithine carbamoyltransferase